MGGSLLSFLTRALCYEGSNVMPVSAKLCTPLSNFEELISITRRSTRSFYSVTFPLDDQPDVSLLVWTTTPWTLPSNLAITGLKKRWSM
jgi:isoleucyl-tRNA synthetase